jgi:hypothetical protein
MSGAVTGLDVSSVYNLFASSAGNGKFTLIDFIPIVVLFQLFVLIISSIKIFYHKEYLITM